MISQKQTVVGRALACAIGLAIAGVLTAGVGSLLAQGQAPAPAAQSTTTRLEIAEGTKMSYRVSEQFVGINFPSDAVGESQTVAGTLVIAPDGSINSSLSKLTVDLRTFKSEQDQRDNYLRTRTFETEKFPQAEFVPRRVQGLPNPFPTMGQAGFQLTGDMTIKGVTKEVTWNGVATFTKEQVAGRALMNFTFATFGLTKPAIGRLLSVDDKIQLELVFRMKVSSS